MQKIICNFVFVCSWIAPPQMVNAFYVLTKNEIGKVMLHNICYITLIILHNNPYYRYIYDVNNYVSMSVLGRYKNYHKSKLHHLYPILLYSNSRWNTSRTLFLFWLYSQVMLIKKKKKN